MECANFLFHHSKGKLFGYISETGLRTLLLPRPNPPNVYLLHSAANVVWGERLVRLFRQYFAGVPVDFSEVPVDLSAGTPFQQAVWVAARQLPWGTTTTYGELAERLGNPGAARAVGNALGANPVPIVVPCHRVLASNGRLGGFSAGLDWKRELLAIEGRAEFGSR